ncbi:thioesterase II family protein [Actinomadura fibrosa]|uniref:Thioesterase II family protein n=1 Tax=Actinomadura fibrosa TaxID=111802 RepID=A0ABW2XZM4_9ACTN|nr:alpha/beta fold hydrolase [Actinomadura fibrosa]
MSAAKKLWLRRFHEGPEDGVRLICFPHAGGAASCFRQFSGDLSARLEVWSVQYPGRQDRHREEPIPDILELARRVSDVVGALDDRPLALFGHSMGATVAFEVARRLEAEGTPPVALFVSGRRAPSIRRPESVRRRDDHGLIAEIKSLDGTDARLLEDDDVLQMILPALRADYRAIDGYEYRPGAPLRVPLVALTGQDDPRTGRSDVEAWAGHTTGAFSLHVMPGGHFFLDAQHREVAEIVADALSRTAAEPRSAAS